MTVRLRAAVGGVLLAWIAAVAISRCSAGPTAPVAPREPTVTTTLETAPPVTLDPPPSYVAPEIPAEEPSSPAPLRTARAGAYCSDRGEEAATRSGRHLTCATTSTDHHLRWRSD